MSEVGAAAAKRYREARQSKAERLGHGEDAVGVDASSFTPGEPLNADAKTGMRPVSRQARASGGAVTGAHARAIGGRAPRKAGGGFGDSFVNRNAKEANEERAGRKHDMGLKGGGRARRAGGGGFGMLGGLLPLAISEMSGGDNDPNKNDALGPTAAAVGKARGGGINRDSGVFKPDKEREGASFTRRANEESGSAAVETRLGRASGGRVAKQGGGPLATPLAAGMGGQGRLNFNFAPNRAQMLADGGKAHERYGHAPGCRCPQCAGGRVARANGGRATYGRSPEDRAFDEDARETLGESRPNWSSRSGAAKAPPKPRARAAGGEVAKKALAAHHAEHAAMRSGRAKGGRAKKGTTVNIVIAPGGANPQAAGPPGMPPGLAIKPPPAAPMPMPGGPPGAPPGAAAPMPMPIPVPMGGGMPPPGMPPRARGGRAPKVRGEPEAGSGSGLGRLQKIEEYGHRSREGAGLRK